MPEDDEDYEVGYGKPPKKNQFQRGVSGNPRGRPKGKQNMKTTFQAVMSEKISVTENGKHRKITRFEAVSRQMLNRALSGDIRSIREALKWATLFDQGEESVPESTEEKKRDDKLMEDFLKRLQEDRVPIDTKEDTDQVSKGGHNDRPINVIPGFYDE